MLAINIDEITDEEMEVFMVIAEMLGTKSIPDTVAMCVTIAHQMALEPDDEDDDDDTWEEDIILPPAVTIN